MGWIKDENGNWRQVDENGELVYVTERPDDMSNVLTREVETGNMINDPKTARTIYNVGNYDVDTEGYKITHDGRRNRRQAINYLTRGNNVSKFEKYAYGKYGDGQFSKFFRDNGNLRRRAFRNDDFLQALSQDEYSTADLGSSAKSIAKNVTKIVNPQLRKKTQKGHWYDGKGNIWVMTGWGDKFVPWCPTCNNLDAGGYYIKVPIWDQKSIDVKKWYGPLYDTTETNMQSRVEYDQVPEMRTEYSVPSQGSTGIITETETIPGTTTVKQQPVQTVSNKKRSVRASGAKSSANTRSATTNRSVRKTQTVNNTVTTEPTTIQHQWQIEYDPDGNEVSRTQINKLGGLLRFISK